MDQVNTNEKFLYDGINRTLALEVGCTAALRARRDIAQGGRNYGLISARGGGACAKVSRRGALALKTMNSISHEAGFGTGMGEYCSQDCQPIWDKVTCGR